MESELTSRIYEETIKDPPQDETSQDALFNETGLRISSISDIRTAPPLQYIVQDLIIKCFIYFLSALAGMGKTVFALALALSIATGKAFLDSYQVHQTGRVLIVDSENPTSLLKDRFDQMGISNDVPIEFLHFQDVKLDNPDELCRLLRVIERKRPVLTIFDSLVRFHSQKENDSEGMKIISDALREITLLDSTVLALHHAPVKATGGHISRGSGEIAAGCDVEYGMVKSGSVIKFRSYKTRVGNFDPIRLQIRSTNDMLRLEMAGSYVNHTLLKDALVQLQAFIQSNGKPPNQTEFTNLIHNQHYPNMTKRKIPALIEDGVKEGYWQAVPGGAKNAILYQPVP